VVVRSAILWYPYHMASTHRTTLILDQAAQTAARQLARRYGCTVSEAIRRSVIGQRDALLGLPVEVRQERSRALRELFRLFRGSDPAKEIRRLKAEDAGF
jgi:hypothetical protein